MNARKTFKFFIWHSSSNDFSCIHRKSSFKSILIAAILLSQPFFKIYFKERLFNFFCEYLIFYTRWCRNVLKKLPMKIDLDRVQKLFVLKEYDYQ